MADKSFIEYRKAPSPRETRLSIKKIKLEKNKLEQDLAKAHENSKLDALTGLPNRRAWNEKILQINDQIARSKIGVRDQDHLPLEIGIILVDIDHFKKINDKYGHDVGDKVLQHVGKTITNSTNGFVARYGGEEIAILVDRRTRNSEDVRLNGGVWLEKVADRIVESVRNSVCEVDSVSHYVTISAGATTFVDSVDMTDERYDISNTVNRADKALYRAKKAGRNQAQLIPAYEARDMLKSS